MSKEQKEVQMYGITVAAMKADIERSLTFRFDGPAMIAMSMMSDAQELMQFPDDTLGGHVREEIRQMLNRAKWVLSTYVIQNDRNGTASLMERI